MYVNLGSTLEMRLNLERAWTRQGLLKIICELNSQDASTNNGSLQWIEKFKQTSI